MKTFESVLHKTTIYGETTELERKELCNLTENEQ